MNKLKLCAIGLVLAGGLSAQSVQCTGFTKDSSLCKNKTLDSTKLCYLHNPFYNSGGNETYEEVAVTCQGTTKKNKPCKNKTKDHGGFCHLHRNQQ